jgi:hypothetical protein
MEGISSKKVTKKKNLMTVIAIDVEHEKVLKISHTHSHK